MTVVGAAVVALLLNDYYRFGVNFDPQGENERFEEYYINGLFSYTSGVLLGHLSALLFGAGLVLADHSRHRIAAARVPDPRTALPAKLVLAVVAGVGFALVNLVVTVPLVAAFVDVPPDPAQLRAAGVWFEPRLLQDSEVRFAMAVGYGAYPLFAALGVGLAALVGSLARVVVFTVGWALVMVCGLPTMHSPPESAAVMVAVSLLLPPVGGHASLRWLALGGYDPGRYGIPDWYGEVSGLAFLAGVAGYATLAYLAGSAVLRRRAARPERRSGSGIPGGPVGFPAPTPDAG
jgi:hypothetical protein